MLLSRARSNARSSYAISDKEKKHAVAAAMSASKDTSLIKNESMEGATQFPRRLL